MIATCVLLAAWGLQGTNSDSPAQAFRHAIFTVVSINTTTGFATDDFNLWPDYLRIMIIGIMMVGGCAGSTSGSLKAIRFILLYKIVLRELQKLIHPRAIFHVKIGGKTIPPDDLSNVVALTFLFLGISAVSAILMSLLGVDMTTSISGSIASLFNIGPGLGQVGAVGNYADLPVLAKVISISCMLMGRLEIYGIML
jgi:trk system potassium uptake protein TrkH